VRALVGLVGPSIMSGSDARYALSTLNVLSYTFCQRRLPALGSVDTSCSCFVFLFAIGSLGFRYNRKKHQGAVGPKVFGEVAGVVSYNRTMGPPPYPARSAPERDERSRRGNARREKIHVVFRFAVVALVDDRAVSVFFSALRSILAGLRIGLAAHRGPSRRSVPCPCFVARAVLLLIPLSCFSPVVERARN